MSASSSSGPTVYACSSTTGRSYRLGSAGNCLVAARVAPVALAGSIVAYGLKRCETDFGTAEVVVRRLTDGRQLRVLPALTRLAAPEAYASVTALVVRADGAVAWIGVRSSLVGRRSEVEVHTADASGTAVRGAGTEIGRLSLALKGSRISWSDGGAERSAPLG
jgi:hypothetical protein